MNPSVNFLGYTLSINPFPVKFSNMNPLVINTINQYSYCVAESDLEFKKVLKESDILLPDGIGVTKAYEYLTGIHIPKIAGADMHEHLLNALNTMVGKCFYLGSTEETLAKIRQRVAHEHPLIQIRCFSPPFKPTFDETELDKIVYLINEFKPDVLFIGLTAPKQEKLAYLLKDRATADVICSIGAVFDFHAGTVNRPTQFWIDLKLEWLIRLIKEPRRMWKRYIYFGIKFFFLMVQAKRKHWSVPVSHISDESAPA